VDAEKYFCRQVKFVSRIKLDFTPVKNGNIKKWLREAVLIVSHNLPFPTRVKIGGVHKAALKVKYHVSFFGNIFARFMPTRIRCPFG
jgi:hypothetical protein